MVEVSKLMIPTNKWKFILDFPEHYEQAYKTKSSLLAAKIWFIKSNIRTKTMYNFKSIPIENNVKEYIPRGLNFFKSGLRKDSMLKIYDSLEELFKNYTKYDIPFSDQRSTRGLTYLFTSDKVMNAHDALLKMKDIDAYLYKACLKICKVVYDKFEIDFDFETSLKDYMTCVLLKYEPNFGIWLHIDNVARYSDEGPLCGVSIGPEHYYMDFSPSLLTTDPKYVPIRLKIPQGSIYSMDGSSRLEWAHGLPYGAPFDKNKYTIMIKCNKLNNQGTKIHNDILNVDVVESKLS